MRSLSSFTPHFYEDVTQSMTQLQDSGAESASLLSILSALYPEEFPVDLHFCAYCADDD